MHGPAHRTTDGSSLRNNIQSPLIKVEKLRHTERKYGLLSKYPQQMKEADASLIPGDNVIAEVCTRNTGIRKRGMVKTVHAALDGEN